MDINRNIKEIQPMIKTLHKLVVNCIVLQCIPSLVGVLENESADGLAKKETYLSDLKTAKHIIGETINTQVQIFKNTSGKTYENRSGVEEHRSGVGGEKV